MLCHDLLEDTGVTETVLKRVLTPDELAAVRILSRDRHDQSKGAYEHYIERIATAPGHASEMVREVKRADLQHDLGRLTPKLEGPPPRYERSLERRSDRTSSLA